MAQRLLGLLNLGNESSCDLFLRSRDDKVEKLFVADNRLVVIRHQINKESALLLSNFAFQGARLQVAGEKYEKRPIIDACVVSVALSRVSWVLLDRPIHSQLLCPVSEDFRPIFYLLIELVCREIG